MVDRFDNPANLHLNQEKFGNTKGIVLLLIQFI